MEDIKPSQNLLQSPKPSKSKYWKFIIGFLAIVLVVFIGFPLAREFYYSLFANRAISNYFKFEKEYLAALKNDTFGGKTPQETYEMFLDTLRKGDILSAAKFYYYDEDKVRMYKKFEELQKQGKLEEWIDDQPKWKNMKEIDFWSKDGKAFEYEYTQKLDEVMKLADGKGGIIEHNYPAGKYKGEYIFMLNKSANIWKVYR